MPDNLKDVGNGVKQYVPEQQNLQQSPAFQTLSLINLANTVGNADTEKQKLETQTKTGGLEQAQKFWTIIPELAQKNIQAADMAAKGVYGPEASVEQNIDLKTGRRGSYMLKVPGRTEPVYFGPQDALTAQQRFSNTQQAFTEFVKQPDNASIIEKRNALRDILNNSALALEATKAGRNPEPYHQLIASSFVRFQGPGTIQNAEFMRSIGVDSVVDQFKAGIGRLTDGKTGRLTPQGVQAFIDFSKNNMQLFDASIQRGAQPYMGFGSAYGLEPQLFQKFIDGYTGETKQMVDRASKASGEVAPRPANQKPSERMQNIIQQGIFKPVKKQ